MNRLLELIRGDKALVHAIKGKRGTVPGEPTVLRVSVGTKNLDWYLADNVSDISVRRLKKARPLLSRASR